MFLIFLLHLDLQVFFFTAWYNLLRDEKWKLIFIHGGWWCCHRASIAYVCKLPWTSSFVVTHLILFHNFSAIKMSPGENFLRKFHSRLCWSCGLVCLVCMGGKKFLLIWIIWDICLISCWRQFTNCLSSREKRNIGCSSTSDVVKQNAERKYLLQKIRC